MLTRRSLLAALAGIPCVAAVARLFRWRDGPVDAHPSPFFLFKASAPRTVTLARDWKPGDDMMWLKAQIPNVNVAFEKARQIGVSTIFCDRVMRDIYDEPLREDDMVLFSGGTDERGNAYAIYREDPESVFSGVIPTDADEKGEYQIGYPVERHGTEANRRVTVKAGTIGIILGNASEEDETRVATISDVHMRGPDGQMRILV